MVMIMMMGKTHTHTNDCPSGSTTKGCPSAIAAATRHDHIRNADVAGECCVIQINTCDNRKANPNKRQRSKRRRDAYDKAEGCGSRGNDEVARDAAIFDDVNEVDWIGITNNDNNTHSNTT